MKFKLSVFNFVISVKNNVIIKNFATGAVVTFGKKRFQFLSKFIKKTGSIPSWAKSLCGQNKIIVKSNEDERLFLKRLIDRAFLATSSELVIYFLPTLLCQFKCFYCLEQNKEKCVGKVAVSGLVKRFVTVIRQYLRKNQEIKRVKIVFFGGEPLLRKDLIKKVLVDLKSITDEVEAKIFTQLITNGELIDNDIMKEISKYDFNRLQITLDGFRDEHNKVRYSTRGESFDKIIDNMLMVLDQKYISMIDLRIGLMNDNATSIKKLLKFLHKLKVVSKISLTLGIIEDYTEAASCGQCTEHEEFSVDISRKYLSLILYARNLGFQIQPEFASGPICFATQKHSVVVKPDGGMQKCFCSVGLKKFDFANISEGEGNLSFADKRYSLENDRTSDCFSEKCPFVPICNGGCTWRAIFKDHENGYLRRSCNKTAMSIINSGLIKSEFL